MKGLKYDKGKVRYDLMEKGFSRALYEVAKVTTFGAEKYEANNWQHVEGGIERYLDAKGRHRSKDQQGELYDEESKLLHAAHEAWNALAVLELRLRDV